MTPETKASIAREKRRAQVLKFPGVKTVLRPLSDGGSFELAYARTGPEAGIPVLVFPGGPGLASVLPYQRLRAKAAKLGLHLVMMEHRGIGLSRTTPDGADLPREAITVTDVLDDAAAILDAEGIDQVVVYGTSYGSYLAQGFGVRHPSRVSGMVLDSAMLGADFGASSTDSLRELFWTGTPATQRQADAVRGLVDTGRIRQEDAGFLLQFLYEFGGLAFIDRTIDLLERGKGRRFWEWARRLGDRELMEPTPFVMEFDLVGEIAFRELAYAPSSDGGPLETGKSFTDIAPQFSAFQGEPFDLPTQVRAFAWPTVVISGDRDIRTPRATAEKVVAQIPGAVLLPVRDHGHSALDTHPSLALDVMHAMTQNISANTEVTRAMLPADPHGVRGLMQRIVSARLAFARIVPNPLS
ncbi:alpha/beta hydrolase [Microbacterium saperdae]|uniref:Pimeloyl-ACP methyl ester carboxylesterase n=1 Tax=Microbacterium saperdae TaxID=69368 RepID=A0A543BN24_9MICO|nr:alpha/beta hydrolase [Microbacterium saperdae]TQL86239.1 pimeloyl-ACP methyl ester carboxylesterase [Microbacterium saperdae]GGM49528.1 alpha/beta hydrolase [Microbacterium saperdae]